MARYYLFWPTNPKATISDGSVTINRWLYDKVIDIIPEKRVVVMGRHSYESGKGYTYGLPQLLATYKFLKTLEKPP